MFGVSLLVLLFLFIPLHSLRGKFLRISFGCLHFQLFGIILDILCWSDSLSLILKLADTMACDLNQFVRRMISSWSRVIFTVCL